MRRSIFFSFWGLYIISLNSLYAQDTCKCDYIISGYYQLVYEAEIAHFEGNDSLAYKKLQEAEQTCPLLNQLPSQEMELYSILLLKNKDFDKAIYYMEKLATEYGGAPGYSLSVLNDSVLRSDLFLQYPTFNDSILPAIRQKANDFYTPERKQLALELTDILRSDQGVREGWETKSKLADAAWIAKLKETDSLNAKRFFEIVEKYGFPCRKLYGYSYQNMRIDTGIRALLMHNYDNFNLERMILQAVRDGECAPDVFGSFIDKGILEGNWKKKSLYGTWSNSQDDEIIDVLHLDERRIAIGMPTRAMEKRRTELIEKSRSGE